MKNGLYRTSMKTRIKAAKIALWPWMHFLDLQGLYMFWTAALMTELQDSMITFLLSPRLII